MKDSKTLASVPIGQACKIYGLGGVWKVIEDCHAEGKVKVQNTRDMSGDNILNLAKTIFLEKC